jgi:hypothetical protein
MFLAAFWELLRFIAIFFLLGLGDGPTSDVQGRISVVWISGQGMLIAAAAAAVGIDAERYRELPIFVASAKVIGFLSGIVYFVRSITIVVPAALSPDALLPLLFPAMIVLLDLLVLTYLGFVVFRGRSDGADFPAFSREDVEAE